MKRKRRGGEMLGRKELCSVCMLLDWLCIAWMCIAMALAGAKGARDGFQR